MKRKGRERKGEREGEGKEKGKGRRKKRIRVKICLWRKKYEGKGNDKNGQEDQCKRTEKLSNQSDNT